MFLWTLINKIKSKKYDKNGSWARTGTVLDDLLKNMLNDRFFKKTHLKVQVVIILI